jgi:hypothetical protein
VTGRREPRRKNSEKLLPRDKRILKAAEIINKHRRDGRRDNCESSIVNMLEWQEWICRGVGAGRHSSSDEAKREWNRVAAWLHRGKVLLKSLHQWPVGFEKFRNEVGRWAAVWEDGRKERKRRSKLPRIRGTPAYAKRFAAEAALHLCDEYGIEPTTTKASADGAFCKLAAALYGDPSADLQKHCANVLEPNYSPFLARTLAPMRD